MNENEKGVIIAAAVPPTPSHPCLAHRRHGAASRGSQVPRHSSQFEGRFGWLFRTLSPAHHSDLALNKLAEAMTAEAEADQTPETEVDDEENTGIFAGYTYFGQFLDHDLTFDPNSSLQKQNDPEGLVNFRSPRFDLDSVYGRGPSDQPYLYADDGVHFLLGKPLTGSDFDPGTRDLPRNSPNFGEPARALIGDPRNDENTIVSQLQSTLLRFHNRIADLLHSRNGSLPDFEMVQRQVRWHYQWAILHDFLPTMIGEDNVKAILPQFKVTGADREVYKPELKFYNWKKEPFIPIEFSAAVYRFGHSMVRPIYRLNAHTDRLMIFQAPTNDGDGIDHSLAGFRAIPENHAVDWTLYFHIEDRPHLGSTRIQSSYKLDTSLVNPLGHLPPSIAVNPSSLAARNLIRGQSMGLPSGQAVAAIMGEVPLANEMLKIGKATENSTDDPLTPRLTDISEEFRDNAPLWYYVLAEAQQQFRKDDTPIRLGKVGGRIVGEVFMGLLFGDSHSYMRQSPFWRPLPNLTRKDRFGIAELILAARGE